jgi:hypothetical protein
MVERTTDNREVSGSSPLSRTNSHFMSRGRRVPIAGLCKLFWVVDGVVQKQYFNQFPVPFLYATKYADGLERNVHTTGEVDVVSIHTKAENYSQLKLF